MSCAVAARRRGDRPAGASSQRPCSGVAEQSREAGTRVEAREAAPVDRAARLDQRRRLKIADQRVVLDPPCVRQAAPPFQVLGVGRRCLILVVPTGGLGTAVTRDARIVTVRRFLPILDWLPRYDRRWLRGDVAAGIAVTALVVPKNLGYAGIAGVPLQNGLYAAAAGALIYAVFCTSRQISTGPSSSLAAVAGGAVLVDRSRR